MLDGVDGVRRHVEAFEEVEGEERGEALRRRRRLPHRVAAIGRADGLSPLTRVRREIIGGEEAVALEALRDRLTHPAAIDEVWVVPQLGQRAGEIGLAEDIARLGKGAAGDEDAAPLGIVEQHRALADGLAHDQRQWKSVRGVVEGGLEQALERARAEALEEHGPRARRPGHRHRAGADQRDGGEPTALQLLQPRARARSSRPVQEVDTPALGLVVEAEEVAAQAAVVGLRHCQHGIGGDGGVHHVAARPENIHTRERGERVAGGHHSLARHGRLPMRIPNLRH